MDDDNEGWDGILCVLFVRVYYRCFKLRSYNTTVPPSGRGHVLTPFSPHCRPAWWTSTSVPWCRVWVRRSSGRITPPSSCSSSSKSSQTVIHTFTTLWNKPSLNKSLWDKLQLMKRLLIFSCRTDTDTLKQHCKTFSPWNGSFDGLMVHWLGNRENVSSFIPTPHLERLFLALCNFYEQVHSPVRSEGESQLQLSESGPASWRVKLNWRSDSKPTFISTTFLYQEFRQFLVY